MINMNVDSFILESLKEIASVQPISERSHYVEEVLEASINTAANTRLIEKLYKDILKSSEIDFGRIGDSKGDLTRYVYYDPMLKSLEILNELVKVNAGTIIALDTANRLHTILLDARDDFTFGFKFDIDIIKYIYEILVMTLYELINCGITEVSDFVKTSNQITIGTNNKKIIKKSNRVVSNARQFIKAYDNGQWASIMKNFKQNRSNFLGGTAIGSFLTAGISTASAVILGAIGIFLAIRGLVFVFYYSKTKISDYTRTQSELIRAHMIADTDQSANAVSKQKALADKLSDISAKLEGQRRRNEQAADKAIIQSNKTDYDRQSIVRAQSILSDDMDEFEFV
jgi:hypothetical protein